MSRTATIRVALADHLRTELTGAGGSAETVVSHRLNELRGTLDSPLLAVTSWRHGARHLTTGASGRLQLPQLSIFGYVKHWDGADGEPASAAIESALDNLLDDTLDALQGKNSAWRGIRQLPSSVPHTDIDDNEGNRWRVGTLVIEIL